MRNRTCPPQSHPRRRQGLLASSITHLLSCLKPASCVKRACCNSFPSRTRPCGARSGRRPSPHPSRYPGASPPGARRTSVRGLKSRGVTALQTGDPRILPLNWPNPASVAGAAVRAGAWPRERWPLAPVPQIPCPRHVWRSPAAIRRALPKWRQPYAKFVVASMCPHTLGSDWLRQGTGCLLSG